jgi:hypothetical protein
MFTIAAAGPAHVEMMNDPRAIGAGVRGIEALFRFR